MTCPEPEPDPEAEESITRRVGRGGQYGDSEGHRPDVAPPDAADTETDEDGDGRPPDCDCGPGNQDALACWPCYREGFEESAPVEDDNVTEG